MGVYSKIVSVPKQIDTIHTFIGGTKTDITSGWTFVNGVRKQVFPSTEYYTEVYSSTTAGSYSESLSWGKYKIVISGGGGSGSACIRESTQQETTTLQGGFAAQEKTVFVEVGNDETKTISGTIGAGGGGAYVYMSASAAWGDTTTVTSSYGAGGAGYQNGNTPGNKYAVSRPYARAWGAVGGSGGGSTSVLVDSVLLDVAAGGNGGTVTINDSGYRTSAGGAGGNGGTTSGTGSAGGARGYWFAGSSHSAGSVTSTPGTDGYVRIYKSNIYPA